MTQCHARYIIAINTIVIKEAINSNKKLSPAVSNPVIDCTNGLESSKVWDMTKMCLQCPLTFRVYLPPTCSVSDDLMVQITLFPECPTVSGTSSGLGARGVTLCVEVCEFTCLA